MRTFFWLIFFVFLTDSVSARDNYKLNPLIDIIHYEFGIEINDSSDNINGNAVIRIKFNGLTQVFDLDLINRNESGKGMIVTFVTFSGGEIKWEHRNDKLTITLVKPALAGTMGEISVKYRGIPGDGLIISRNKFGNRTFFADHWPDRARNYLPCIDHPSDKATVDFIIMSPAHYRIVSNGYLVEESDLPGGQKLTHWKEDIPIPMKVMAFAAASFAVQYAGSVEGTPVWTWVYPENRKEGFYDYSVATKPLAFYSTLIGPYSFEKLANVQSKTIFGGMENAGCIFYSENSVTGQGKDEELMAHEIAHQWFGNSVTEKDWHHIWLSEGFATYLTAAYLEKTYGREKLNETMKSARERVIMANERTPGAVIDTTITDLMRLLSANSYQKGAWVLHMLRQEIGDEDFWKGMQMFYKRFRNMNALTGDFRKTMEEASRKDLGKFFYQWLYVPGQPELQITTQAGHYKDSIEIRIEQKQKTLFSFKIDIMITGKSVTILRKVNITDRLTSLSVKGDIGSVIIPDPDVRLLFRQVQN